MKKTILYLLAAVALVFSGVSCTPAGGLSPEAETFMTNTEFGIYKTSTGSKYQYDKATQQTSIRVGNSFGFQFKMQNDEQSSYFIVKTSEVPATVGKSLKAEIKTKAIVFLESQTLTLEVVKVAGGKAWLWSEDKQMGFLIDIES